MSIDDAFAHHCFYFDMELAARVGMETFNRLNLSTITLLFY